MDANFAPGGVWATPSVEFANRASTRSGGIFHRLPGTLASRASGQGRTENMRPLFAFRLIIAKLTPDLIEQRHRSHAARSKARANLAMRYIRALINFAMVRHLDADGNPSIPVNPVNRLSQLKLWHRVDRRQTLIQNHELQA